MTLLPGTDRWPSDDCVKDVRGGRANDSPAGLCPVLMLAGKVARDPTAAKGLVPGFEPARAVLPEFTYPLKPSRGGVPMGSGRPYGSKAAATEIGPGMERDRDLKFSVSGPGSLAARMFALPAGLGEVPKGEGEGDVPRADEFIAAFMMAL